jgi:hypothetical protein
VKLIVEILAVFVLFSFQGKLLAQKSPILNYFHAIPAGDKVNLRWEIQEGNTCNGIEIHRSVDRVNFYEIGEILGICGNLSFAQSYEFSDEAPVYNTINYYRLTLGFSGYSEIASAEIIKINKVGYQIRPHPLISTAQLYFSNSSKKEHSLNIYNYQGVQVYNLSTVTDFFTLDRRELNPGNYFFIIIDDKNNPVTRGKLLVY